MRLRLRYTGSPWLMGIILLALTVLYIGMTFRGAAFMPFMDFLLGSSIGAVLLILLAINQIAWSACLVIKGRQAVGTDVESIKNMDVHEHLSPRSSIKDIAQFSNWIKSEGYRPVRSEDGVSARRGLLSILPGIILRAGIAITLVAMVAGLPYVTTEDITLTTGQGAHVLGRDIKAVSIDSGMPAEYLSAGADNLKLDNINVRLLLDGDEFIATGRYPVRHAGLYWRVIHLGYAQHIEAADHASDLILDILPPGNVSTHEIGEIGAYEFRLWPERSVKKGIVTGDLYNMHSPRYKISPRGKKSGAVIVQSGEEFVLEGVRVKQADAGLYVRLSVVDHPALPVMKLGLGLVAIGLMLMLIRLGWYERRFAATMHEGRVLIGYSEEFYGKWGVFKFRRWMQGPPFTP